MRNLLKEDASYGNLNEKQLCIKTISSTINENSYYCNSSQKENIRDYFNNLDKCAKGNGMAFYV